MKAFVLFICLFILSTPAFAAEKPHIEWNEQEITTYVLMNLNQFLQDRAPFSGPDEAGMLVTCHMASALQILRNEGIIYRYEVNLLTKAGSDEVNFHIKVLQDVGGKVVTLKFKLDREKSASPLMHPNSQDRKFTRA